MKIIYSAFVRSILEYYSVIWDPTKQVSVNKIEKFQKFFDNYVLILWNIFILHIYPFDTNYN